MYIINVRACTYTCVHIRVYIYVHTCTFVYYVHYNVHTYLCSLNKEVKERLKFSAEWLTSNTTLHAYTQSNCKPYTCTCTYMTLTLVTV